MVDHINHNRCEHVVTLESPIEHVHDSDTCLIDHREIGVHTNSLADGFKAILHEQPDVVVMGDLEDAESVSLALRATEAGILVFATMRSASTAEALDRLIGFFPVAEQDRARALLAVSLKSVLGHWMIRFGSRMLLAMEVLHVNKAVARALREGRLDDLTEIERQGGEEGMQTFEQAVAVLVKARKLDKTVARRYTLAR
jgi:twitching motility protein PilT